MGSKLSVIILFNLALAHHLDAISSTTRNLQVLRKALKLYELAYQLHTQEMNQSLSSSSIPSSPSLSPSLSSPSSSLLLSSNNNNTNHEDGIIISSISTTNSNLGILQFTLIISNNIGEIHRVVGNQEEHNMCLQHLLKCMMYIVVNCKDFIAAGSIIEMDGFYRNIMMPLENSRCARAA